MHRSIKQFMKYCLQIDWAVFPAAAQEVLEGKPRKMSFHGGNSFAFLL